MIEFWTVVEVKMLLDGTKTSTSENTDDENTALGRYFSSLADGATNGLPYHATYMISSRRGVKKTNIYNRIPEPVVEQEAEPSQEV